MAATMVSPGLTGSVRSVEAEQEPLHLRHERRTLLVRLGCAPRADSF